MSGGTRSYEMARRMVAAGHEVHMVTSIRNNDSNQKSWLSTDEAGINVHWYPVPYSNHMSFLQRIKAFFAFAFAAQKKAASLQGDVVFATSTPLTIALPAVFTARKLKVPMVFEVRDLWPEMPIAMGALKNPLLQWTAKKLEHWAYQNSAAVVALSPGMKEGVVKAGYPANRVAVIPNSSDNLEFRQDSETAKQFRSKRAWLGDRPLLIYAGAFSSNVVKRIQFSIIKFFRNLLILKTGAFKTHKHSFLINKLMIFLVFLLKPFPKSYIFKALNLFQLWLPNKFSNKKNIANFHGAWGLKEVAPASIFQQVQLYEFEGNFFYSIKDASYWLTKVYGDFMQYPPEHKRVSEHIGRVLEHNEKG